MEYKFKYDAPEDADDLIDEIQGYCSRKYQSLPAFKAPTFEDAIEVDLRECGGPRHHYNVAAVRVRCGSWVEVEVTELTAYLREHATENAPIVWEQRPFWQLVKGTIGYRDNEDLLETQGLAAFQRACAQIDEWTSIGVAQRWN